MMVVFLSKRKKASCPVHSVTDKIWLIVEWHLLLLLTDTYFTTATPNTHAICQLHLLKEKGPYFLGLQLYSQLYNH